MTRKEREREFKRQEIIYAAVKIFATKGYKSTTLDDIAEASEFGKGTIYNYFQSKEDIYKEIIISTLEKHRKSVYTINEETDSLYNFIYELMRRLIVFSIHNREAFLLLIFTEVHHARSMSTEISKVIEENQKEMTKFFVKKAKKAIEQMETRNVDPEKTIRLFRGIGFNYISNLLLTGKLSEEIAEDEAAFITDILFNGIKY